MLAQIQAILVLAAIPVILLSGQVRINMRIILSILLVSFLMPAPLPGKPSIGLLDKTSLRRVGQFDKLEISFLIANSTSSNPQWPFDPKPPNGIPAAAGISADGIFIDPEGRLYRQPAFYFQEFREEIKEARDWLYPEDTFIWKIRFSPVLTI